jgi:hypothetical protein
VQNRAAKDRRSPAYLGVSVVLERKIALRCISSLVSSLRRRFQAIRAISPLFREPELRFAIKPQ